MKKTTALTIIIGLLILVAIVLVAKKVFFKTTYAGLQIKSIPNSTVLLDGKNVGRTPFEDKKLAQGEVTLKLIPEGSTANFSPWERNVKLVGGTQTVVNWEFSENESSSAGEIMTLEKIGDRVSASLMIISSPDSSLVRINEEPKGFTPVSLDKQEAGEKRVVVTASGFEERDINLRLLAGYRLILNVKLAEARGEASPSVTPTSEPTVTPKPGAKATPTPKASPTPKLSETSPSPKPTSRLTPTTVALARPYVTIKETPTGFLRVRSEPSTQSSELARVNPGESFSLVEEKVVGGSVWYKIPYQTGSEGWISGQYAEKFE